MNLSRRNLLIGAAAIVCALVILSFRRLFSIYRRFVGGQTVEKVLSAHGARADRKWLPLFTKQGLNYPPRKIVLIATKLERKLEVWARGETAFRHITTYPILGASGTIGPKLIEGDKQVPEGVYHVSSLNPNSEFYLSLELDYPNEFDRAQAAKDGRTKLGGDIFIHGGRASIGCLAMGDEVIEELFILVARTGRERCRVVIAPQEPTQAAFPAPVTQPISWLPELHRLVLTELVQIRGGSL
jgi:murein L,D-transpeptidase YafK